MEDNDADYWHSSLVNCWQLDRKPVTRGHTVSITVLRVYLFPLGSMGAGILDLLSFPVHKQHKKQNQVQSTFTRKQNAGKVA